MVCLCQQLSTLGDPLCITIRANTAHRRTTPPEKGQEARVEEPEGAEKLPADRGCLTTRFSFLPFPCSCWVVVESSLLLARTSGRCSRASLPFLSCSHRATTTRP